MSDHVFYAKGKSRGNQRKVIVLNPQLLISKPPTKSKRIKMKFVMGLSTQKQSGTPEWIAAAHEFVAKNHDTVTPAVDFKGFDINLSTENLFGEPGASFVRCQMKSFVIEEQGKSEEPDIVLTFVVYAPFSTEAWNWLGQMAGDEIWAKFDQVEVADEDDDEAELELTADEEEVEETEEEESDDAE